MNKSKYAYRLHPELNVSPNDIVHHIDHNRSNNDLSNLMVMTRSDHTRYHSYFRAGNLYESQKIISCYTSKLNRNVLDIRGEVK